MPARRRTASGAQVHQLEYPPPGSPAAAFPRRLGLVQREPAHVLASLLARRRLLGLGLRRAVRGLFGLDPAAFPARARVEFAARALGAMLEAAATDPAGRLSIDYADLPGAVWQRVARISGSRPIVRH